jgi:cell division protease FtsH
VTRILDETELPSELSAFQAVDAAYPVELARCYGALRRRLPVLVECEKELSPYIYKSLRDRLKVDGTRCLYLDGRPSNELPPPPPGAGLVMSMIHQIREVVRGAVGERIVVLPHLDILGAGGGFGGGLGAEARELIPLLYENPEVLWLGFKDPSFGLPKPIENLFPHRETIIGIPRERLRHLITQREARKFGRGLDPYALYKHVSGVNAVRLRRLLSSLTGEDYPTDPAAAVAQLRSATLSTDVELPNVDLDRDIGGYGPVKDRLKAEILAMLAAKDKLADPGEIDRIESLVPRGMIFWGPPGTGKTLFAKAMATALGAAVQVVSGPELKSKWVGESEENLRGVFMRARQSAPSVIVFDELDSFAAARGTYTGSGVEHSMVNQLLTEMDGFRREELVFVVGTTNFVESLDPALLRPGRFEFALHIPYPNADDRRAILGVHDRRLGLAMTTAATDYAVKRTEELVPGPSGGTHYSGDHLQALCRQLARTRLRESVTGDTAPADVERAIEPYVDLPKLTAAEEIVVATHEAGHAICALGCKHAPPIDRISIRGDIGGALGYVRYADRAHRYVVTYAQLRDTICTLFGGREAEVLLLDDVSIGASSDIENATDIARAMVERYGEAGSELGVASWAHDKDAPISEHSRTQVDHLVSRILEIERARAREILDAKRPLLIALRDLLVERKVLDRASFAHLVS